MEPARQFAQLGERREEILDAGLERRRGGRLGRPRRQLERERNGDKTLLGAVVEVALDPSAGVGGGRDDARARLLEPSPRIDVGDRLRNQLGERTEARLRVSSEPVGRRAHCERTPQLARTGSLSLYLSVSLAVWQCRPAVTSSGPLHPYGARSRARGGPPASPSHCISPGPAFQPTRKRCCGPSSPFAWRLVAQDLLQGIDNAEIIAAVHACRAPMVPVSASLRL